MLDTAFISKIALLLTYFLFVFHVCVTKNKERLLRQFGISVLYFLLSLCLAVVIFYFGWSILFVLLYFLFPLTLYIFCPIISWISVFWCINHFKMYHRKHNLSKQERNNRKVYWLIVVLTTVFISSLIYLILMS